MNYVDTGIIKGKFVKQLDVAVQVVKSNQKVRLEYMTYQMALLESKLEGEERGREKTLIENLQAIMDSLQVTAEKAMDILKIPQDKRNRLLSLLNN